MMLVLPQSSIAWELRSAWATGRRVALSLQGCSVGRLEGFVQRVAATDALVRVAGYDVPLVAVLAVHYPSRLGDSSHEGGPWRGRARLVQPQRERLPWAA
jgi:hypothetical protein